MASYCEEFQRSSNGSEWLRNSCLEGGVGIRRPLNSGLVDIDNNASERAIKSFVMGRKGWLFSDTVAEYFVQIHCGIYHSGDLGTV